jgi:hypothetical protein
MIHRKCLLVLALLVSYALRGHFQCRTFGLSVTSPKFANLLHLLGLRHLVFGLFLAQIALAAPGSDLVVRREP